MAIKDRWCAGALALISRVNHRRPWSHNNAYGPWMSRQAMHLRTPRPRAALDVGCGTGDLLHRLSRVTDHVTGIEPDRDAADVASNRFAADSRVRVVHGGFDDRPAGSWDLVTFVAVLHHLRLEQTLRSARKIVKPGGRLVVVGLSRDSPGAWSMVSILLNPLIGLLVHPRGDGRRPVSAIAPTRDAAESLAEIRDVARRVLPGARVRAGPFWRYTLVWRTAHR